MPLLDARDILSFPSGNNASDTIIGGINFNLTTLNHWNYTLYTNGTLSNWTNCFLTFEPYTPHLLPNGTFLNTTSCYSPLNHIGRRAIPGISFAVFFALSLVFTMINLRKHGRLFLPSQKRFRAIGRRWQWYWLIWVAANGMASGFTSVDVDRYYLPEWPLMLNCIFWYMMIPSTLAVVWESVRHWGSWQERQLIDPNPFILDQDDKRGKTEFYMPLAFYAFGFLNFFMSIPRNWSPIAYQRSADQTIQMAEPQATDGRFKSGAFFLLFAWLVIVYSLRHSIHHYKPRNRGVYNSIVGGLRYTPVRFLLTLPLALVIVGYQFAISFDFAISPLNNRGNPAYIYGFGWAPIALITIVHEVAGYLLPNEDRELIRQRRVRGAEIDAEMGYTKKPHWWRRLHGDHNLSVQETIAKNAREVGGGPATRSHIEAQLAGEIELHELARKNAESEPAEVPGTPAWRTTSARRGSRHAADDTLREAARVLFPASGAPSPLDRRVADAAYLMSDECMDAARRGRPKSPLAGAGASPGTGTGAGTSVRSGATLVSERSASTGSVATLAGAQAQQVKSMLDI